MAVHDMLVHPRENDLILATHGRSFYVLDDATPVQTMTAAIAARPATLFDVRPALRFALKDTTYALGDAAFRGKNPPYGAIVTYYLKNPLEKECSAQAGGPEGRPGDPRDQEAAPGSRLQPGGVGSRLRSGPAPQGARGGRGEGGDPLRGPPRAGPARPARHATLSVSAWAPRSSRSR